MKQPKQQQGETYRHILVAVAGQTPQIVTETLYALIVQRRIPISEIYIITTTVGARIAQRELLAPEHGQYFAFCRDYGINPKTLVFDEQHIITIKKSLASSQQPVVSRQRKKPETNDQRPTTNDVVAVLDDIRTVEDNAALAQHMCGIIKELTSSSDTALHCSIAGGRKSMSAYLALALMLYGRQQDTLTHVLVPEEFEGNRKFFFPPKQNQPIAIRRGNDWEVGQTKDALIELAEIPFVRLRDFMGDEFARLDQTVEEIIKTIQYKLAHSQPPEEQLIIDLKRRQISYGTTPIRLQPMRKALYAFFACVRKERRESDPESGGAPVGFLILRKIELDQFAPFYRDIVARSQEQFVEWLNKAKKHNPLSVNNLQTHISKINDAIENVGLPSHLQIVRHLRLYGDTAYGILLSPDLIDVIK